MPFKYRTRKLIKPEDLNCRGTLFGGRLLSWIDEECGIYCACQMKHTHIITKYMSEINFISPATNGEVLEIGVETAEIGRTFLSVRCHVRTMTEKRDIIKIDKVTFVSLNASGKPVRHALAQFAGKPPVPTKLDMKTADQDNPLRIVSQTA
ncbi:acyl-CoA thioesterase [Litorimonas sp. RW-G-Af-16]|uniref:acyl-CoA thioesterase n=1 Tax=Litorimonas sp. RW-G-Af-16 TaxID=3241168 RepID=UPI00390CAC37